MRTLQQMGLTVVWEDSALKLLESRDRYTRNMISKEFRRDPEKDAIVIDTADQSFLTPVSDKRFSVIWRRDGKLAIVRAVIPLTNLETVKNHPNIKSYVGKIVQDESGGEITL